MASKGDCSSIRLESGKQKQRHRPAGKAVDITRNWSLRINEDEIQNIWSVKLKLLNLQEEQASR